MHKEIRDDCRRNRTVGGFAYADQAAEYQEAIVARHEWAKHCCPTPQRHAQDHDPPSGISVAEIAEHRRTHHVRYDEGCLQQTTQIIANVEFTLDVIENT